MGHPRFAVPLALLGALAPSLAGCGSPPEPGDVGGSVVVTPTTGALQGIVLTEALVPLSEAVVSLADGADQATDDEGRFVFNGLPPGAYFPTATKAGYMAGQASAVVEAGRPTPLVSIVLRPEPAGQLFAETSKWDGFLGCGVTVASTLAPSPLNVVSANVCPDPRFLADFPFGAERIPLLAQAEATWQGTQPLSDVLEMGYYDEDVGTWKAVSGLPPLVLPASDAEMRNVTSANGGLAVRMFPGHSEDPLSLVLTTNQAFTVYMTYFHGFAPRPGWTFIGDGACHRPADCGGAV